MSLFESLSKYREGFRGTGRAREHFEKGFRWVFGSKMRNAALWDHFIELAWTQARNALYHGGTVGPLVFLDTSDPDGIVGLIAHP